MSNIVGTAGDDTLVGTTEADVMDGGAGRDRLNGGDGNDTINGGDGNDYVYGDAGDDELYGGAGRDTLVGDAGNDVIHGGDDTDGVFGGGGNDHIYGEAGNDNLFGDGGDDYIDGGEGADILYGGSGNDRIYGGDDAESDSIDAGSGNDVLVYQSGGGADRLHGSFGIDTLELAVTSSDVEQLKADLAAFSAWLDARFAEAGGDISKVALQNSLNRFTFESLNVEIAAIEEINLSIDGVAVDWRDLLNAAPEVAETQSVSVNEDEVLTGSVGATDADGDAMTFVVSTGPANGSVNVDVDTGAFVYTPAENFSGDDSFEVVVTDVNGASTRQLVQVSVNAVADAPGLTVSDVAVQIGGKRIEGTTAADVLHGTAGSDIVVGGEGNDVLHSDSNTTGGGYQVALDVRAALSDLDGSEALAVVISGVPAGASLSAGEEIAPGVWQVAVADLAGLSMTVGDAVDVTLTVSATSRESSGEVATVSATLAVTFEGVDPTQVVDILQGGSGDDTMIGGDGFDYVDFSTAGNGVNVSLRGGTATGDGSDTFTGIEGVIGSDYSDRLVGDRGDNVIIANDGDDRVYSGGGNDTIYDGAGHDKVRAGSGDDVIRLAADGQRDKIDGGRGFDTIDFTGVERAVMLNLDNGNVRGASGNDKVRNIEGVIGGSADDDITGSKGDNALDGGAGNDVIRGGRGADLLTGGEGDDIFVFEVGDVISGRTTYGVDTITDFVAGDQLDFSDFSKGHKGLDLVNDVHLTNTDAGIVVSIDMGGRTGFVDVVLLEGVHDLTIDAMIAGDHFIV